MWYTILAILLVSGIAANCFLRKSVMKLSKLDQSEALRYMGYGGSKPDEQIQKILDECEKKLLEVIAPRYIYKVMNIKPKPDGIHVEETSLVLGGKDIAEHLAGCDRCVLMCATVSQGADRLIRTYEATDMTRAVMTDCLASAAIEQVCNAAEEKIKAQLSGNYFTWRFSPGYGDMPMEIQRDFLEVLNAPKRIGLNVTESMIMIPRKSVTAVMGVSETEIPKGRRGCVTCRMKDVCAYRKRGEHCGS